VINEDDGEALKSWWVRLLLKMLPMRSEPLESLRLTLPSCEAAARQGDMLCRRDRRGTF
jgi:hypothetical protein